MQDPGAPIELPTSLASHQVDYEAELAVVIGRRCKNVAVEEALAAVKAAHRRLVKCHHPDMGGDAEAFRRINAAYQLLIA